MFSNSFELVSDCCFFCFFVFFGCFWLVKGEFMLDLVCMMGFFWV